MAEQWSVLDGQNRAPELSVVVWVSLQKTRPNAQILSNKQEAKQNFKTADKNIIIDNNKTILYELFTFEKIRSNMSSDLFNIKIWS